MSDHEHQNSPVEYKTVQVKFENGDIGAVDVHSSMSNFEKLALGWIAIKSGKVCFQVY